MDHNRARRKENNCKRDGESKTNINATATTKLEEEEEEEEEKKMAVQMHASLVHFRIVELVQSVPKGRFAKKAHETSKRNQC